MKRTIELKVYPRDTDWAWRALEGDQLLAEYGGYSDMDQALSHARSWCDDRFSPVDAGRGTE